MKGWKEMTLADISSDISYGYTESAKSEKIGPKFLRITDIANGRLNWDTVPYCPISVEDFVKYKLSPGDIVVARTGATTGANYIIKNNDPTEAVFASYLIRYRIDQSYADPNFIGQVLRSITWQDYVDSIAGGSAQPGANAKQLGSFTILLPPLPEQKAIAAVLSSLDDKIDLLHRQNKTLEAMAETLFRQWFVEEADEGWEEGKLSQYVDIGIGRTPPRQEHEWFSESETDIKWISIKDLGNDGTYIFNTAEYLTHNAVERFNIPVIPANTVVLSFKMTVGRVAITTEKMLSNEAIAHFKFKHDTPFSVEYLYFYLKTYQYDSLGSTSSIVTAINSAMIKDLSIIIPDISKMNQFNNVVKRSFEKIRSNQVQIRTLESLRDTLLPKLMSGEVRVKV
jgi:type I restriction enzyme S subunit